MYRDVLPLAVYPRVLPFDLWDALGRVVLVHLGAPRFAVLEALDPATVSDTAAADRLGLSPARWALLAEPVTEPWARWGYDSESPGGTDYRTALGQVSAFLQRGRLDYDDLLDLLHARFANPDGIVVTGSACNRDFMHLDALGPDDPGRMDQVLRLRDQLGWSLADLDRVLYALGITALDAGALGALADVVRLVDATGAGLSDIASWWSTVDTWADRADKEHPEVPLYDRVFLDKRIWSDDSPFALNADRSDVADDGSGGWQRLSAVTSEVQAALGSGADELSELIAATLADDDLTLANLSVLYRYASYARALALSTTELLGLTRLTGLDPFATPAATVSFTRLAGRVRDGRLSIDELHYLLEHDADADTRVGIADEDIALALAELREGLARVVEELQVEPDPTGATAEELLAALLDPEALAEVMAALGMPADATDVPVFEDAWNTHLAALLPLTAADLVTLAPGKRHALVQDAVVPVLVALRSDALVVSHIATFIDRDLDATEDLLTDRVAVGVVDALPWLQDAPYTATDGDIEAADDPEAFDLLRLLFAIGLILRRLDLGLDAQQWWFDVGISRGLLDPTTLPVAPTPIAAGAWDAWWLLARLFALEADLPGGEPTLVELLGLLDGGDQAAFRTAIADRADWPIEDVDALADMLGPVFPDDWTDGTAVGRLVQTMALVRRTGAGATAVLDWSANPVDEVRAEAIRLAAKSVYDDAGWSEVARGLRDPLRNDQRDALAGWLIAHNGYPDEDALYQDLLIDVEMDACMLTSRIKLALSSVQLFVHRALLNLEDQVDPSREDRDQWRWRKNYRVWEAARKVLLYPENWVEPELRTDKSPFFEALENELLQGELTDSTAETAYLHYLEQLVTVARLEVMSLFHQVEESGDDAVDLVHVVARTRSRPHRYFYRQWEDGARWTAWDPLDIEVDGDHLVAVVWARRLFLFWPLLIDRVEQIDDGDDQVRYQARRRGLRAGDGGRGRADLLLPGADRRRVEHRRSGADQADEVGP